MENNKSKVYIIGAGPGDPGLITVKGLDILKKADCVLYDFLSSSELLDYTKPESENICVGKADGLHLKEQDEINQLLFDKSKQHNIVVRLKGGDPFVFSRGFEELGFLKEKGILVEAIPGVTSAFAGPSSFNIPLTVKNRVQSVGVVTGRKEDPDAEIDAPKCGTLVYLMAVANIKNVLKALYKNGWSKDTSCAFIERATQKKARIVRGSLNTIEEEAKKHNIKPPAVFVVGEVAGYEV